MMRSFRDRPIKQKLVILTLLTTGTGLCIATLGNLIADSWLSRIYLQRDLSVLAQVIADNSTATLAFDDPQGATQVLHALKAHEHIDAACIYREAPEGRPSLFAQYAPDTKFTCPSAERIGSAGDLTIAQPVILDGRRIGTLLLYYDLGELYARMNWFGGFVMLVLLLSCTVAFLLSKRLQSIIVAPVSRLVQATTAVSNTGDYTVRAERVSADELGVLVDRFNEMLAQIESRDNKLKKALQDVSTERARFEFMAESMPQKIFTATPGGEIDYVNRQWLDFTGLTREAMMGSNWSQFVHPDDLERNVEEWKTSLHTGEPLTMQQRFLRADGQYRWHLSRAHAMRNASGKITMWIGSNTDIHEQKETEQELRRANEDLQQFAYSASHDLREPIRNVTVYSEVIARRYRDLIDEEGRTFLGFLKEGGQRLGNLVNDLLAYTRASMGELSQNKVDANAALRTTLETLAGPITESHAVITADALPTVSMGELHLQQIFQNLVGNAIKYSSRETPRIHVSVQEQDGMWQFAVRDNGIGIDPQYKERIFGVFKRLSNDPRYAGTGIGLAICQRIVERYGGRIWVESEIGAGSTFYFTIPRYAALPRATAVQSKG